MSKATDRASEVIDIVQKYGICVALFNHPAECYDVQTRIPNIYPNQVTTRTVRGGGQYWLIVESHSHREQWLRDNLHSHVGIDFSIL